MQNTVSVYVRLLEEETPTVRPTQAIKVGKGTYKLLPATDYDPEDEIWEFLPGSIVHAEAVTSGNGKKILLAKEKTR